MNTQKQYGRDLAIRSMTWLLMVAVLLEHTGVPVVLAQTGTFASESSSSLAGSSPSSENASASSTGSTLSSTGSSVSSESSSSSDESSESSGSSENDAPVIERENLKAVFMESDAERNQSNVHPVIWIPKNSEIASAEELMQRLKITATNRDGDEILVEGTIDEDRTSYMITLGMPEPFTPGLYRVQVILSGIRGETRAVQTFFRNVSSETPPEDILLLDEEIPWGLIALNADRSVYTQGQQANMELTVLDDNAHPLCGAEITVEVTAPDETVNIMGTEKKTVQFQEDCAVRKFTSDDDYTFTIPLTLSGEYTISVRASSSDKKKLSAPRTISRTILVQEETDIVDIRRNTVTRTYPENTEVVALTVIPSQTFVGTITERVPMGFTVQNTNPPALVESMSDETTQLTWNREWTIGIPVSLSYTVQVPEDSPRLSLFGPASVAGVITEIQETPLDLPRFDTGATVPTEIETSSASSEVSSAFSTSSAGSTVSVGSSLSSVRSHSSVQVRSSASLQDSSASSVEETSAPASETPDEVSANGFSPFVASLFGGMWSKKLTTSIPLHGAAIAFALSNEPLTPQGLAGSFPPRITQTGTLDAGATVEYEESRSWEIITAGDVQDEDEIEPVDVQLSLERSKEIFQAHEQPSFRLLDMEFAEEDGELLDSHGDLKEEKAFTAILEAITTEDSIKKEVVKSIVQLERETIAEQLSVDSVIFNEVRSALGEDNAGSRSRSDVTQQYIADAIDENTETQIRIAEAATSQEQLKEVLEILVTEQVQETVIAEIVADQIDNKPFDPAQLQERSSRIVEQLQAQSPSLTQLVTRTVTEAVQGEAAAKTAITDAIAENVEKEQEETSVKSVEEQSIVSVKVRAADGLEISVPYHFEKGSVMLVLDPVQAFTPGLYTVIVEIENPISGEVQTLEQDFVWGVLAMNANKDQYEVGDIASLHFGVLDDLGRIVCDADLQLTITKPNLETLVLSTEDNSISVTGACGKKEEFLIDPDYEAFFAFDQLGTYNFNLVANTDNGTRSINYSIDAIADPRFSIQRRAATRLWPEALSSMEIQVTFHEAFQGRITDIVPPGFGISDVSPQALATQTSNGTGSVYWTGSWAAGETATFSYAYDAPDISPQFYLMGPLVLDPVTGENYEEKRAWQIANDDTSSKTPASVVDGCTGCTSFAGEETWTNPSNAATDNNSYASVYLDGGGSDHDDSHFLFASQYAFNLPSGSTINGVTATIRKYYTVTDGAFSPRDTFVNLYAPGTGTGTNKSTATTLSLNSERADTYGGSSDLWGLALTEALVENSGFGLAYRTREGGGNGDEGEVFVDSMELTVTYTPGAGGKTITGRVYSTDTPSGLLASKTISASLNGASATSTTTDAGGMYTISSLTMTAGTIVTLYIDGNTEDGVLVTLGSGSNMTGMNIYQDHLIVRSESGSHAMTIDHLNAADAVNDSDIAAIYTVSNGILSVRPDKELFVWAGDTFTPGARVRTHDLEVKGTMTMSTNGLTVTGSLIASAGTFTTSTGVYLFGIDDNESLTMGTNALSDITIDGSLVGYWKFDEGTANIVENAGYYGYDGTFSFGGRDWTTSVPPRIQFFNPFSMDFNGSNTFLTLGNRYDQTGATPFSLSAWVYMDSAPAGGNHYMIVTKSSKSTPFAGYRMYIDHNRRLNFYLAQNASNNILQVYSNATQLSATTWYHVAATYDGSKAVAGTSIFVDGVKVNNTVFNTLTGTATNSSPFQIGALDNGDSPFNGKIDDVRIYDRKLNDSEIVTLYNGNQGSGSGRYVLGSALATSGFIKIYGGTLDTNSSSNYGTTLSGSWMNYGGFTKNSATVTFDGVNQVISGSTVFHSFTKAVTAADSMYFDWKARQSMSGTLILNGATSQVLSLRSTKTGSGWNILLDSDGGTQSNVSYLDVRDSDASGGQQLTCLTASEGCVNTGNNTNWLFTSTTDISGTVYSGEGTGPLTSKTIRVAINGTDSSTTTTNGSGQYSFTGLSLSANDVVTIYIEDATEDGVVVTLVAGNAVALTGVDIYQDRLIVRNDTTGSVTNANLSTAAVSSENDISNIYSVSAGALTVASAKELLIWTGDTFAPGGSITTPDLDINGTLTLSTNSATISSSWDATGGSFTTTGTVTFTSTSGTKNITSNGSSFNNVTFNGVGGTWDLSDAIDINGTLTLTNGTFDLNSFTMDITGGTFVNNATLRLRGSETLTGFTNDTDTGTVTYDGTSSYSSGLVAGDSYWNLTFNGSGGTWILDAALDVNNDLTITAGTLDVHTSGNYGITIGGNYANSGTFTARAGTVTLDATDGNNTFNPGSSSLYNFTVGLPSGSFFNLTSNTLTITGTFTLGSGNGAFDLNGQNLNITGGTFVNNGTLRMLGSETLTGFTNDIDSGGIQYDTTGTITGLPAGNTYWSLSMAGPGGGTVSLNANVDINNNYSNTITNQTLRTNGFTMNVGGSWTNTNGSFVGTGTVIFDRASGTQTLTTGGTGTNQDFQNMQKSGGGTLQFTTNNVDIDGTLTIDSSTTVDLNALNLTAGTLVNNGTLLLEGGETVNIGVMDTDSGLVTYDGTSSYSGLAVGDAYYDLRFNRSGATWTLDAALDVNNDLTITAGTLADANFAMAVGGNWSNAGTYTGGGTVTFDKSSGTQTLNSGGTGVGQDFQNLTKGGGGTLQFITNNVDIDGTMTINSSTTVDINARNLTLATLANNGTFLLDGSETVTISSMDTDSGNVTYDGTSTYSSGLAAGDAYYDLRFNGTGGSWILDAALDVNNDLTISAGTLDVHTTNNYAITVGNDFTNAGTFTPRAGTVTFDGTTQTISGSTVFYNFTKAVGTADTMQFNPNGRQAISGALVLNGATSQLLTLRSTANGTPWRIILDGDAGTQSNVSYLNVRDSNASGGQQLVCYTGAEGCIDSTNNTNWLFGTTNTGTGSITGTVWNDLDGDHTKDAGETTGLQSVSISISGTTATGQTLAVANQTTDSNGAFSFTRLVRSNPTGYTVAVASGIPAGYLKTGFVSSGSILIGTGTTITGLNFGYVQASSISGAVFVDLDKDGVKDAGETSVFQNVSLSITGTSNSGNTVTGTQTTNSSGLYAFRNLGPSTVGYTVSISGGAPTGYVASSFTSSGVVINQGNTKVTSASFGYYWYGTMSGVVFRDDNFNGTRDGGETTFIPGITITLTGTTSTGAALNRNRTTSATGAFFFYNVPISTGNYTLTMTVPSPHVATTATTANKALSAGANATPTEFGLRIVSGTGSISGTVWNDLDGDHVQDGGETTGLENVVLSISGTTATGQTLAHANQTTDSNGAFSFTRLSRSNSAGYTVAVASGIPAGYLKTGFVSSGSILIGTGTTITGLNFGYVEASSISGSVFVDLDKDGVKDGGETSVFQNVSLSITGTSNSGNTVTGTQTTGVAGTYAFRNLGPSNIGYTVSISGGAPSGYVASSFTSSGIVITQGGTRITSASFGYYWYGTMSGIVFRDDNSNGVRDGGETDVFPNVSIALTGTTSTGAALNRTRLTSSTGAFFFYNVPISTGNYTLTMTVPSPHVATTTTSVNRAMSAGTNANPTEFGLRYVTATGSIAGTVWNDLDGDHVKDGGETTGLESVVLSISGNTASGQTLSFANQSTNASGQFTFSPLVRSNSAGYTVSVVSGIPSGYLKTGFVSSGSILIGTGTTITGLNFGYVQASSISGAVFVDLDKDGVKDGGETSVFQNVVLSISGTSASGNTVTGSQTTASNGVYAFRNLGPSVTGYTVSVTSGAPTGYVPSSFTSSGITIAQGNTKITSAGFGYYWYGTMSGVVFIDDNEDGILGGGETDRVSGVTISLTGTTSTGGALNLTRLTSSTGAFFFNNVPISTGNYSVAITAPASYAVTTAASFNRPLNAGQHGSPTLFGLKFVASGTGTIKGTVWNDIDGDHVKDAGETTGLNAVTVNLNGTTATGAALNRNASTNAAGQYFFSGTVLSDPSGYTVAVTSGIPAGYLKTGFVSSGSILIGTGSVTTVNFGYVQASSISGSVFVDLDKDGVRDAGENSVFQSVNLSISGTSASGNTVTGTQTSNSSGLYAFRNLGPSITGYTVNISGGAPTGYVASSFTSSGMTIAQGGTRITSASFGYYWYGTLSGVVFSDTNQDGVLDGGETGRIAGVNISLTGTTSTGAALSRNRTTSATGAFFFYNVPISTGNYTVTMTVPANYFATTATSTTRALSAGQNANPSEFGLRGVSGTGGITGTVWLDTNGDHIKDVSENGIQSVVLSIAGTTSTGQVLAHPNQTTLASGIYSFSPLSLSNGAGYTVSVASGVPSGYLKTGFTSSGGIVIGTGTTVSNLNFGYVQASSISGSVFVDLDKDGVKDGGETSVFQNVSLSISGTSNSGNTVTGTQTTGVSGTYAFRNLGPSTTGYTVSISGGAPAGYVASRFTSSGIVIAQGDTKITSASFGYYWYGTMSGIVFRDDNFNGIRDGGETARIEGVTISLTGTTSTGAALNRTRLTSNTGAFFFYNVPISTGNYTLTMTVPSPHVATTASTANRAITAGANANPTEFGIRVISGTGSISGTVWNDADGDHVKDAGETTGLESVVLSISGTTATGQTLAHPNQTTDASGLFSFAPLSRSNPSGYTVAVASGIPAGYLKTGFTSSGNIVIGTGTTVTGLNFGYVQASSISGSVFVDLDKDGVRDGSENSVFQSVSLGITGTSNSGNTVTGTQTTSVAGTYAFRNLGPSTTGYTVSVTGGAPAGYVASSFTSSGIVIAQGGTQVRSASFGYYWYGTMSGIVFRDDNFNGTRDGGETGVFAGVTINLTGTTSTGAALNRTRTTSSTGAFFFYNVPISTGNYAVTMTVPAPHVATTSTSFNRALSAGQNANPVEFGLRAVSGTGSISGTVWNDLDGDHVKDVGETTGLQSVVLSITGTTASGQTLAHANQTTDSNGVFTFTRLSRSDATGYTVSVTSGVPTGYLKTGFVSSGSILIGTGTTITGLNFGYVQASSISGSVFVDLDQDGVIDGGESGRLQNVSISITGTSNSGNTVTGTQTTNSSGIYAFRNLGPSTAGYTVSVASGVPSGYTAKLYTSSGISIAQGGTRITTANIGYFWYGTMSGVVFNDSNGNGVRDGGETTGFSGATLTVSGTTASGAALNITTRSTSTGAFTFLRVPTGASNYTLSIGVSGPYSITTATSFARGISVGTHAPSSLFGVQTLTATGTVQGYAWNDLNGNGQRDGGETSGFNGRNVQLSGTTSTGGALLASRTTNVSGFFTFTGTVLSDATGYTVALTAGTPNGYIRTTYTSTGGNILGTGGTVNVRFGFVLPSTVSGSAFIDTDSDGVRSETELDTFSGAAVILSGTTSTGASLSLNTITNGSGEYLFDNLPPSLTSYTVAITPPSGYVTTSTNSRSVTIATGDTDEREDFGFEIPTVGGTGGAAGGQSASNTQPGGGRRGSTEKIIMVLTDPDTPHIVQIPRVPTVIVDKPTPRPELTADDILRNAEARMVARLRGVTQEEEVDTLTLLARIEARRTARLQTQEETREDRTDIVEEQIREMVYESTPSLIPGRNIWRMLERIRRAANALENALDETAEQRRGAEEAVDDLEETYEDRIRDPENTQLAEGEKKEGLLSRANAQALRGLRAITDKLKSITLEIARRFPDGDDVMDVIVATQVRMQWVKDGVDTVQDKAGVIARALAIIKQQISDGIEIASQKLDINIDLTELARNLGTQIKDAEVIITTNIQEGLPAIRRMSDKAIGFTVEMSTRTISSTQELVKRATRKTAEGYIAVVDTTIELLIRSRDNVQYIATRIRTEEVLRSSAPNLPPQKQYRTVLYKQETTTVIATLHINFFNAVGEPLVNTPVVLFSSPKVTMTDEEGVATFHNVPAGAHELEIHTGEDTVEKRDLQIDLPASLTEDEIIDELDVALPMMQIVVSDNVHGAAPVRMPTIGWVVMLILFGGNLGWGLVLWKRKGKNAK